MFLDCGENNLRNFFVGSVEKLSGLKTSIRLAILKTSIRLASQLIRAPNFGSGGHEYTNQGALTKHGKTLGVQSFHSGGDPNVIT